MRYTLALRRMLMDDDTRSAMAARARHFVLHERSLPRAAERLTALLAGIVP